MFDVVSSSSWPTGYLIKESIEPLDPKWLREFQHIPASAVSDCLGRNLGGLGLKPYHGNSLLLGSALTVRVRPGDNLMILKAIQMANPGDVLVIDGSADLTRAVFGGIMRAMAIKAGIVGVVINGAIRDLDEWASGDLPVYAIGVVHRGPSTDGGGEINVPVSCAGMLVNPGDLITGDVDGVVAARRDELPELLARCHALLERERSTLEAIEAGTLDPARFDALLRAKGCPI
ncbi:RraA family protein [Pseudomonas fluorescens]|uniref:Putative 4-hydroxy-4-methyl-2-oxoglutarate aldolase n=1 Tax=Pseudomonas fluorescens TaxID=294 RepID=A0AAE2A7P9_PSEFL|nr:RraA family protein [Pseudomonas fluorescens]KIF60330.1 dimethylmenaquinone methyltransferase [Pseudomonas fluorescens]